MTEDAQKSGNRAESNPQATIPNINTLAQDLLASHPLAYMLVAKEKKSVRGYLLYSHIYSMNKEHPLSFFIDDLFVDFNYRSKGIGTALLQALKNEARIKKAKGFYLFVDIRNKKAMKFYEHLGVKRTEITEENHAYFWKTD